MANEYQIVEENADTSRVIARAVTLEDAERIIAALRTYRNDGGAMASNEDVDWEVR